MEEKTICKECSLALMEDIKNGRFTGQPSIMYDQGNNVSIQRMMKPTSKTRQSGIGHRKNSVLHSK